MQMLICHVCVGRNTNIHEAIIEGVKREVLLDRMHKQYFTRSYIAKILDLAHQVCILCHLKLLSIFNQLTLLFQSRPFLNDRRRFTQLADPLLKGRYPLRPFYQLSVVTSLCLHEKPNIRPAARDVAYALNHIASQPYVVESDGLGNNISILSSPMRNPQLNPIDKEDRSDKGHSD